MKKQSLILLAVILTLALCLSLTACNGKTVEQLQNEFGALLEGGKFEEGSVLNFDAVDSTSEEAEDIFEKLDGISAYITDKSKAFIYDISVTKDGKEVQPDGTVKLTVPVPQGSTETDFTVFHVKDSGEAVKIAATYADGKLTFETDGFSYYVIVATAYVQNTPVIDPFYGKYQHKLTVTPAAAEGWYIRVNGECKDVSEGIYLNAGETHILEAVIEDGWRFEGWYDADTNELLSEHWYFEIVLNKNRNLMVKLTEAPRRLAFICDIGGRITIFGADNTGTQVIYLDENASVTLTAVANEGYEFVCWKDGPDGEVISESEDLTITMDGDKVVRACFRRKTANVSFTVSPADGGYFERNDGTTCTEISEKWEIDATYSVCAVANIGYRFVGWRDQNGNDVARGEWLSGTVPADGMTYQAVFEEIPNQLTVTATEGGKFRVAEIRGGSEVDSSLVSEYKNAFLSRVVAVLEAEADEGYRFVGWFDEQGEVVDRNLKCDVPVAGKVKIEARFEKDEHTLTVRVSPAEGGYITENGVRVEPDTPRKVASGTNITLTAVPNEGYAFVGWYHNDTLGSEDPTLGIDVIYDLNFEARFVKRCTLIVTVEPAGSGYITENGQTVDYSVNGKQILLGENVDLTAEPMDGYQFVGWFDATTGERVMEDDALSYTMEGDCHLIARFKPAPYELELDCAVGGEIALDGAQYTGLSYVSVDREASVTLKALPSETYEFVGWYDKATSALLSESAEYAFVMDGSKAIQARFKRKTVSVSVAVDPASGYFELPNGSTCTEISGSHEIGESIEIKAVAHFGYRFLYWENMNTGEKYVIESMAWEVPADGLQYRAVFEEIPNQITVTAVGGGNFGVAEGDFGAYSRPVTTYQKTFDGSERIRLIAKADEGYRFAGWFEGSECVSENAEYQVWTDRKVNLRAVFIKDEYYISADVYTEGGTYPTDGGYITEDGERIDLASGKWYPTGTDVTLTAVVNDGYVFVGWQEYRSDGSYQTVSEELTCIFVLDRDQYIFACFEKIPTVGFLAQVSGQGDLTENGQIVEFEGLREVRTGTKITLTAVPRAGYRFKGWTDATVGGEAIFSTAATYEFTITKTTIVTAIFEEIPKVGLTIITDLPAGGSVTQNGLRVVYSSEMLFAPGTDVTLQAAPSSGYRFVGWYDSETGYPISKDATYTVKMTQSTRIEAIFELIPPTTYRFLLNLSGNGGILQNGVDVTENYIYGATFEEGTRLTLKASADDGNHFVGWYTSDNVLISADAEYTFVLNADMRVRAVFEANPTHRLLLTIRGNGTIYEGAEPVSDLYANGVSLPQSTTVVLTAVADEDSQFAGWYTSDGTLISTAATYSFEMNADIVGYAKFEEKTIYNFIAYTEPYSGGYLEENAQIVEFGNGRFVTAGTKIKLTAVANEGYAFKGWGMRDENWDLTIFSTEETYEFTVNADTYVYAVFEAKVTGIELDAHNAGFAYETVEGLGLILADKTVVQIGAQNLPKPENVVVYAVKADGSVALNKGTDYTIDLGGLDFTKEGIYTITYTYVHDTSLTATLTVEVEAAADTGMTEAEWNAAIAYWKNQTNVKAFERTVSSQSYDPQYGAPGADIRIYQLAGNAYSFDGYMENDVSSQQYKGKMTYLAKQGNKYYRYTWDDGEWDNELETYVGGFWKKEDYYADMDYTSEIDRNIYGCCDSYGELIVFSYANFTYDSETKSYKNSDGSIAIAFTFDDNKKLTQITITMTVTWESGSGYTSVRTITFGDAVVDIPTDAKCSVTTAVRTENSWDGTVGYITENGERVEYHYDYLDDGTVLTLTAVANDGYVFKRWAKEEYVDGEYVWVTYSTNATYTFTVDGTYGVLFALFEAV